MSSIQSKVAQSETARTYGARLAELAAAHPNVEGLTFVTESGGEQGFSYAELETTTNRLARALLAHGVGESTVLAMPIKNSPALVMLCFAVWKLGGCALPLNPRAPHSELVGMTEAARSSGRPVVVVSEDGPLTPDRIFVSAESLSSERLLDRVSAPGKAIGSGGSTGRPKIVVDPRPWMAVPMPTGTIDAFGRRPEYTVLVPGPLYHNGPFVPFFVSLFDGAKVLLMERFDAAKVVDLVRRYEVEWTFMVPTQMARISRLPDLDPAALRSLKGLYHSGSGCAEWLKRQWIDLIGAESIYEVFGSSEQIGALFIRGDEWLNHPNTVGRPALVDLRILDPLGQEQPPGEVGEIFMRWKPGASAGFLAPDPDPSKMYAYWGSEPLRTTDDGFATAGDLGYLDNEGYLHLADRRHDLIISGGANVYPSEVEQVIGALPGVEDVVVIGVPDAEWGQRVHAVIELSEGPSVSEADLDLACREHLAPHKRPKAFEFVDRLPRSEAGKIRRTQIAAERAGRSIHHSAD
ncbi:class I adenylate-forming enzyme family protein [Rhodococcus aetherivorans]